MRLTGLDSNDSHHKRIGEKDIKEEDIIEQEPNDIDKKTTLTTSTMTSSIIDHIICAISHFCIHRQARHNEMAKEANQM